ncbi:MAG: phage head spike fiber domain-containing protein, partial [Actinomycetota bacterium]
MHYPFRTGFRWLPGASLVALAAVVSAQLASASNLVESSADFDRWSVFRGARVAANAGAAPDGSVTADQVFDSTTENGARIFSNTVTANGGSYVFSCYLKAGSLSQAKLTIADGSGSSVRGYIQPSLTADWQRYSVAIPNSPTGSTLRVELYPGKFDKENGFVWAWGAQLEAGTTPSAYESTSGGGSGGPDVTSPAVPSGLRAALSNGAVQVEWTPNQEADLAGYRLQRSRDAGSFAVVAEPTDAAQQDANVSAGSTYQYRVSAVDASGNASEYSSTVSVTLPLPDVTPPPASGKNLIQYPEEFEKWGSFREAGAVANAGAAPTGAATADRVVDSVTQNGAHVYSNTVTADGGAYTLSCYLRAGTLTKAKLALFDAAGGSVRGFVEPNLTNTWQRYSVTVSNAPQGSTLRAVIYAGKFDKEAGYVWAWGAQLESGSTPTAYESASGDGGGGDTGPTPDTTPPAAPTGLSARLNGSAIQVLWSANREGDLAGYRVERGVNSTTAFSNLAAPTAASYNDAAVLQGNSYSYRIRAVDTTGNLSAPSTVATVAIPLDEPTPTGALNVVNFGANPAAGGDDAGAIQAA